MITRGFRRARARATANAVEPVSMKTISIGRINSAAVSPISLFASTLCDSFTLNEYSFPNLRQEMAPP